MTTVIYGDDIVSSRNYLIELKRDYKKRGFDFFQFDSEYFDLTQFIQAATTESLFKNTAVFVENLFSIKQKKVLDRVCTVLKSGRVSTDIILWENRPLGQRSRTVKSFANVQLKEYKLPKTVFKCIQSITPSAKTESLQLLKETLEYVVPEVLFVMIVRQFRLLLAIFYHSQISETKSLQSWQLGIYKKQLAQFNENSLTTAYKKLFYIDYAVKTGKTPYTLTTHLEKFIINL
jgi:DNA polymerase III delta subunit